LQVVQEEVQQGLSETSLAGEYLTSLNGTITQAVTLQEGGSFREAGMLFRETLRGFPGDPDLISKASLAPAQIIARIDACAQELMARGLVAYRSGDLPQAIDIWGGILLFHPQFEPARTARDTAEKQFNNLRTMGEQNEVGVKK